MKLLASELKTRFGTLSVVVEDESQKVIRSGFLSLDQLLKGSDLNVLPDRKLLGVAQVVSDWVDGDLKGLTKVKTHQSGSEFAQSCYGAMKKIQPGSAISYLALAAQSSNPKAVRAAASTCARNQNAPFVPCHRVITSRGEIGNYAFSKPLKKALLLHEGWKPQGKLPVE
jgi:methylated-DNA-[protein]-cysteine S-methyltransferase